MDQIYVKVLEEQIINSPHLFTLIETDLLGPKNSELRLGFFQLVDDSVFSLQQWLESLYLLQSWLNKRDLKMRIEDRIGYICCASDSAGASASITDLSTLVLDMLDTYGCNRAQKKN